MRRVIDPMPAVCFEACSRCSQIALPCFQRVLIEHTFTSCDETNRYR